MKKWKLGRRKSKKIKKEKVIDENLSIEQLKERSYQKRQQKLMDTRKRCLKILGFSFYKDYLNSDLWKSIRPLVFQRCGKICEVCNRMEAREVHHRSYCMEAMIGKRLDYLVACCRSCHERAEFNGRTKNTLGEANYKMHNSANSDGRVLNGMCHKCKRRTAKMNRLLCSLCRKEERLNNDSLQ